MSATFFFARRPGRPGLVRPKNKSLQIDVMTPDNTIENSLVFTATQGAVQNDPKTQNWNGFPMHVHTRILRIS